MNVRSLLLATALLSAPLPAALAQDAPRQLNTLPTPPPPAAPDSTARPVAAPAPVAAAVPSRYRIGLKSGQVYAADVVEMRQPVLGRSYLLANGQQRFDLDQIKFYEDETGHYVRTTLPGSRREATLRRDKTGRISTYSITTTQYSPNAFGSPFGYGYGGYGYGGYGSPFGYPYGGYRTVRTEYFSKDGGPIEEMNFRSLRVALADNPGSVETLRDVARLRRISTAGYVVGGGLMAAGILSTFSGTSRSVSPLLFISVPVLLVPSVISGSQHRKLKQAVALYNAVQ
ncbi:hypothetical protein F0P96_11875 [Hymenobacter busanensis]|uniref:DUF4178 domain-containing protein n=1 Tax=Hymenobacter busanensis TaxID=2607656 RepID=A0AA88FJG4_9BACT|nr:hypothetical protein [Hymenobacter busanensis]KAA9332177.1 hypothetical protein F0P96_11875 [Hymenobacter busanensis]